MSSSSPQTIHNDLMPLSLQFPEKHFLFFRPADLETLWEGLDSLCQDERIPYWVEIWPASILLSQWLIENRTLICNRRCLEVGCGLGVASTVASHLGARAYGLDYEFAALAHARLSAFHNQVRPCWFQMDWRKPGLKAESFDFILGADILYEKRFFAPLISLFHHILAPGGKIWLSTPNRQISNDFFTQTKALGWQTTIRAQKKVSYQNFQDMEINIWEICTKTRSGMKKN